MVLDLDLDKPDPDPVWPDLDPAISGSGSGLPRSRSGNIRILIRLLPDPRFPMDYPLRFRLYLHDNIISNICYDFKTLDECPQILPYFYVISTLKFPHNLKYVNVNGIRVTSSCL